MQPATDFLSPAKSAVSGRLKSIDVLRGVAILWVLAIHIPHEAVGGWRENPFFFPAMLADFGYFGVPLFIVISGFCIHRGAAMAFAASGSYRFNWPQFWKRRFIRLYPPYVAAICVALACAFLLHDRFPDPRQFLGWDLVAHLLLFHNLTHEYATSMGNGAFWSLGTEEQLYALYFVLLLLLTAKSSRVAIAVVAVTTVAWRLIVPHFPEQGVDLGAFHLGHWYQWPLHYWLHWALGALAVDAFFGNRTLPKWCLSIAWGAAFLAMGLVFNRVTFDFLLDTQLPTDVLRNASSVWLGSLHNMGELMALLGFFCVLNWSLRCHASGRVSAWAANSVAGIGRISYSVYLVHVPVIYILVERFPLGSTPMEWLLRYATYTSIALGAGYLFHLSVERWFLSGRLPGLPVRTPEISELRP